MQYSFPPHSSRSRQAGFTLVEMLIVMALFSIMLVVVTQVFTTAVGVQNESKASSAVTRDGRYIMERLEYDVARATAIATPSGYGSANATTTLQMTVGGETYTYALASGNLQLTTTGTGTSVLNGNTVTVSGLNVQRYGIAAKSTVKVSLTITSKTLNNGQATVKTFTTTVGQR